MSYGFKFNTRTKLIAGALALALAGASHAATSTTLVGGGATLPSVAYVGANAVIGPEQTPPLLQMYGTTGDNGIASGSLFGVYAAQKNYPAVSYCLTGSGAGKDTLASGTISGNTYSVQNACAKNSNGVVNGFGAPAVSRTDLTYPDFAAADSPLAGSDITDYQAEHGSTAWPTQFPVIAGAIAIGFNIVDNTGAQVTGSEVNFTDAELCEIFSGTVTNWDDSRISGAFKLAAGHSIPSEAINVQYRSDGSGTSFSFSNHLSNVCPSYTNGTHTVYFQTSQNFTNVVTGFPTNSPVVYGILNAIPTNWTGSSGNQGVANSIIATGYSIGYVELANALQTNNTKLQYADVNSTSPVNNFGLNSLTSGDFSYNYVINTVNATNGTAQMQAISSPPSTKCIALVNPAEYAVAGTKGGLIPTGDYPIIAVSYFLSNATGTESGDLTNVQNLLNAPYNSTITGSVTTVGATKGLLFLTLGTGAFSATAPGSCI
jgi:phosphate transport system substrate-binding protein